MKKQKIYIDTSVFGGYFDIEFAKYTQPLFERIDKGEFMMLLSTITQEELEKAPLKVVELVTKLSKSNIKLVDETDEAVSLELEYIEKNVVGQTSYADCLHIAIATINEADLLLSWNFGHIVNIQKIRSYNSINIRNGYKTLDIRSPREILNYDS